MTGTVRIGRAAFLYGSVLMLNALWLVGLGFSLGGLPDGRPPGYWFELAVVWLVLSAPWMVAAGLLSWAWRAEARALSSSMDSPARMLAAATATLPEGRREWGVAMTAELAQVRAPWARWRFALGCARVAIFLPRSVRFPAVVAAGITGVGSCVVATWYMVDRYPAAALYLHAPGAIVLAAILAAALWFIVAAPRALTGDRLAGNLAVGVALLLGLGLLQASRADLRAGGSGIFDYLLFVPVVAIFATGVVMAALRGSLRAGVQATVWTAVLTSLGFFAVAMAEAVRWYRSGAGLILDGETIPFDAAIGVNIRNFTGFLILLPFFWTPFGVIGAAIGRAVRARLLRAG